MKNTFSMVSLKGSPGLSKSTLGIGTGSVTRSSANSEVSLFELGDSASFHPVELCWTDSSFVIYFRTSGWSLWWTELWGFVTSPTT